MAFYYQVVIAWKLSAIIITALKYTGYSILRKFELNEQIPIQNG